MPNEALQSIVKKISQILFDFFKKEKEIKTKGEKIIQEALAESNAKRMALIKDKINQI